MRILVTGAGGYIGSVLVPLLLARGHHVCALDRFFFGEDKLAPHEALEVLKEDTRRLSPQHFHGIDAVIDLAALSNDPCGDDFGEHTLAINHAARVRAAMLAKRAGVPRYLLPSSCSVYGWQDAQTVSTESSPINPLTTYAKANARAEEGVLALSDEGFCVTVLRQATVFGYSPRMRFDLAINGMTYGAWKTGKLPLMRDGSQWRPMVHVRDTSRTMAEMLEQPQSKISGEVFNVGSEENVYQIGPLGELIAALIPKEVHIEWYGDPDHRSYRVSFEKLARLGIEMNHDAAFGVQELIPILEEGLEKTPETITIAWYRELVKWHKIIQGVSLDGEILDLLATTD